MCEKAIAPQSRGSESPRSLYWRLPEYGRHQKVALLDAMRYIELPSGSLAGGARRELAIVQQHGSPLPPRSREAYV